MKTDISDLALIPELEDGDLDLFKTAVKLLVSRTFILRGLDREEKIYDFTIRNIHLFDAWFACMDGMVKRDESLGVIAFKGGSETRARMGREETCALLVLRLLYEEKRAELSLAAFPTITVFDFLQKFRAIVDQDIKKTRLKELLRRLKAYKLVDIPSSDSTDPDSILVLYPSLAMSLDHDGIDEILKALAKEKV